MTQTKVPAATPGEVENKVVRLPTAITERIAACEAVVEQTCAEYAQLEETLDEVDDFDEDDISTVKNITAMLEQARRTKRESAELATAIAHSGRRGA